MPGGLQVALESLAALPEEGRRRFHFDLIHQAQNRTVSFNQRLALGTLSRVAFQ